jgi:hypothetical protein
MVLNIKNNLHLSSLLSIRLAFVALTPGGYATVSFPADSPDPALDREQGGVVEGQLKIRAGC